ASGVGGELLHTRVVDVTLPRDEVELAFTRANRGRRLHAGGRGLRSGRTASRRVGAARGDRDHRRGGERSQPYPHGPRFDRSHSSYLSLLVSTAAGFGSGGCC